MAAEKKPSYYARAKGTAERGQMWVERQDPASTPGVTIGWFRRYVAADGQLYAVLLTSYIFLTVLPAALVLDSYLETDPNALANSVIKRLGLHGSTEDLFRSVLQGAGGHKIGATLIALGSVALFGLGIGRVLQLTHARAWGLDLRKAKLRDQARYLQVLLAILLAIFLYALEGKVLHGKASWIGWAIAPLWLLAVFYFFVWAPRLLLHNRVPRRDIVPGAVFTLLGLLGMRIASHYLLVNWLEWYGKYYGGLGIVMALFFWVTILATVLVLAAALSPALAHRRDLRQERRAAG
ncbi:MAG: YhjD/YihY/BrkB family envelope integrity protein [Gaiellaceae bacterium]